MESVYEKFKKLIAEQKERDARIIQQQQEEIQSLKQQEQERRQKEAEKIQKLKQREAEKREKLKQQERDLREKAFEKIRKQEKKKLLQQLKENDKLAKKEKKQAEESKQRLAKETKQWEKEIKQEEKRRAQEEKRRAAALKKFRTNRNKLQKKLERIQKQGKNVRPRLVSDAIRNNTSKWSIDGKTFKDPRVFLNVTTPAVKGLINSINSVGKKVNTVLVCKMVRSDPATGKKTFTIAHFRSKTHNIVGKDDVAAKYTVMKEKMLESLAEFQKRGSGWQLHSVEELEIFITKYTPLSGRSYRPLPKSLNNKKAIININNDDNQCFKWAITRALNPVNNHPERVTKILKMQAEKLNWEGLEFPTKVKDIHKFEKNNEINVNVFSYDNETKKVYTLRLSKMNNGVCVNLFLYDEHYSVVKNMSRLISTQLSNNYHKKYFCTRCLNAFGSEKTLQTHLEYCQNHDHQHHVYPEPDKNDVVYFNQYHKLHKIPFVVYADFESFIEPIDNKIGKGTVQYQKHTPSGFCYTIKCMDEKIYEGKTVLYTMKEEGEDIGKKFVSSLEEDLKEVYKILNTKIPIRMTEKNEENFKTAENCYACKQKLGYDRVRDHCHLTGKYRGAAHFECNLKMRVPKFVPVLFHNLEGYDSHLFVKSLGLSEGKINCIPKTDEKYISFSKEIVMETFTDKNGKEQEKTLEIRFLDSLKFTLKSLDSLVGGLKSDQFKTLEKEMGTNELLKKKGVFPYEFMSSFDKLDVNKLPSKINFHSKLNNTDISDEEYKHAQNVWKTFKCKTMRDYHNLYLKTDVMLLADVMENYRNICIDNYELDPLWYYTAPGLAWNAALKISNVKLELITDPNMYLMVENGIRGGVSTITKRYAKANNPYMQEYNPEEENVYIPYLDANNLYGWAMSKPLPTDSFEWMTDKELQNWTEGSNEKGKGCILEVDLEYPKKLHNEHNEYPLAPERLKVNKVDKLIPNLRNKEKYVIHYENLKLYLNLGLKLTKIHRGIKFNERAWLKDYIQLNTDLRTKGKTDFEKDFFKLMNNAVFGKTMENIRNRVDVRLVTKEEQLKKLVKKPNFDRINIFTENLVAVHMKKTTINLNKPIYLGMSILELSKTLMYDFHYNYIKKRYGKNANLLFTDTDSLCYEIKTQDFYKDIAPDVHNKFDTSNFNKDHSSGIKVGVNKKVIGMMKDETGGKQIKEFVGLRSKLYAYKIDYGKEEKKCKGVKKGVVKNEITFEDYKKCLFSQETQYKTMNTFRSRKHDIYTERITKIALSANDDKRNISEDGINTTAIGHWRE